MIRFILISLLLFSLPSCLDPDCANEIKGELISPDKTKKIVLFSRGCGATTGFNTQASILDITEDLTEQPETFFTIDKASAKVKWISQSKILVIIQSGAQIFKQESLQDGITIEYREE